MLNVATRPVPRGKAPAKSGMGFKYRGDAGPQAPNLNTEDPFNIVNTPFYQGLDPNVGNTLALGLKTYQQGLDKNANMIGGIQGNLGSLQDQIKNQFGLLGNNINNNLATNQDWLKNQFGQALQGMPLNPYTDQMRQSNLAGLQNQIQTELQSYQNQAKRGAAASGVGGSLAGGAQAQLQGAATGARANAARQTLMDQFNTNQQANQARAGLISQFAPTLTGQGLMGNQLQLDVLNSGTAPQTNLAGLNASVGLAGMQDPMAIPNFIGGAMGTNLAQQNATAMLDYAKQQAEQQQKIQNSPWNPLGMFASMMFPGATPAITGFTNWMANRGGW